MLDLHEIAQYYPENLRPFRRFLLREYLQYKILEIVFSGPHADKLIFLGGTCLRIVHGNQRFSEDLDFDNFGLSETDFKEISNDIDRRLTLVGYEVEVRSVSRGAFHCYIRFPKILFQQGLSGYEVEKILIQLDTEAQHFEFIPESVILNKFDVFSRIAVTPLSLLMAQKCYAILNRPRNKGRDFFDLVFLMGKNVSPDYDYLNFKRGISDGAALKSKLLQKCHELNMAEMARDVAPFLFSEADEKKVRLFPDYLNSYDFR